MKIYNQLKNNLKKLYIILLLIFVSAIVTAQVTDLTRVKNKEGNNDVVIINDNNVIDITGVKANFINFSFTKKLKFKVLNTEGIKKYSKFILPEIFDPSYISHFPKDRNYSYVFTKLKCNYFKGTITTAKGEKKEAKIKQSNEPLKMVMVENNLYGNFEKNIYRIDNLEPGDEVSLEYNYLIPYMENFGLLSSFRIFFNNDLFKENYKLTLTHESNLDINIYYKNGANPDSTSTTRDDRKIYYWNKRNLSGCINEEGSIPYKSLPYLIFSIKPPEMLYTLPYSFEQKYVPFYSIFSYMREKRHLEILKSINENVRTKDWSALRDFVDAETNDIKNDSLGYSKLMKIQNKIADEFKFANDTDYFKRIDILDPKIGKNFSEKTLRDINRYDMYVALILKLGLNYLTTYICDNRSGEINNEFFAPMYDSDYLFTVVLKNNSIQYLYPKKSKFGYYLNEVPFYLENAKARMVNLDDYRNFKKPINEEIRQITLPNSIINDNIRRSNILVKINLDSLTAFFEAKINLSGQYSTITRGLYQNNYKDETVNKLYNKKIWELNDNVKLINMESTVNNKEFPFSTTIKAQYKSNDLIKRNGDTISFDLKNWFNHIIYNNIDINTRQLDFYPDFSGKDTYIYFLQFDRKIKLLNSVTETDIKNDLGELKIKVEQLSADAIMITSYFSTPNKMVSADKIKAVKDIYDKIIELNKSYLKFKIG